MISSRFVRCFNHGCILRLLLPLFAPLVQLLLTMLLIKRSDINISLQCFLTKYFIDFIMTRQSNKFYYLVFTSQQFAVVVHFLSSLPGGLLETPLQPALNRHHEGRFQQAIMDEHDDRWKVVQNHIFGQQKSWFSLIIYYLELFVDGDDAWDRCCSYA